jgi:hypothetical protein
MIDFPDAPNIVWPSIYNEKTELLSTQFNTTNPIQISNNVGFTSKAVDVLYQLHHLGYNVYHIIEECKHDGYDNYGPKSDIWYLHIFTYDSVYKPIQIIFTWENWYLPRDKEQPYGYLETNTLNKYPSNTITGYTLWDDILKAMI